jgi:hypothetical protein
VTLPELSCGIGRGDRIGGCGGGLLGGSGSEGVARDQAQRGSANHPATGPGSDQRSGDNQANWAKMTEMPVIAHFLQWQPIGHQCARGVGQALL